MKKIIQIALSAALFVLAAAPLFAQDPGVPGKGAGSPGVPIDGGASLLAAAGVAYGVKKYRDHKKAKAEL